MDTPAARAINIGPRERRKRLAVGIVALSVGVIIAGLLVAVRAPLVWRLPLFVPFHVGALGWRSFIEHLGQRFLQTHDQKMRLKIDRVGEKLTKLVHLG